MQTIGKRVAKKKREFGAGRTLDKCASATLQQEPSRVHTCCAAESLAVSVETVEKPQIVF